MSKENFGACLTAVLEYEGGYVNNPRDPGGATNKGVTQKVYDNYRKRKALLPRSVKLLTWDELREIYRYEYWDKVHGDDLPSGVDHCMFDFAVNSGVSRSIRYTQNIVGVTADGQIGPATLAAIKNKTSGLIDNLCDARLAFLKSLNTWLTFGKGWAARVAAVRTFSHKLAKA